MSWYRKEKLALLRSIILILRADNDVAASESAMIVKFLDTFGLSSDAIDDSARMDNNEMASIISNFTQAEKEAVKAYWFAAANADGKVLDSECKEIAYLSVMCDVSVL